MIFRICGALAVLLAATTSRGQNLAAVANRLPASARLALVSADIGATCTEFQQTGIGQTLTGPNFATLIDHLRRNELGGPLNLRPIVGFDWKELEQTHDPSGLVVFPTSDGQMALAWVFLGNASSEEAAPLPMAELYFGTVGFEATKSTKNGFELTTLVPPETQKERRIKERVRVIFSSPGFYGIVDSLEGADLLMGLKAGESLANSPLWQQAAQGGTTAEPRPGDVTLFLLPFELWELAESSNPPAAPAAGAEKDAEKPDPLASSRQVGFDGVRAIVGQLRFPIERARDWELSVRLVTPRPYAKGMRLLEMSAADMPELPDFLPPQITSASFWQWDFVKGMQGYGNLFDEANEPGPDGVGLFEDMLDGLRDDPEGVQVDLRKEVFANLGPSVMSFSDRGGAKTEKVPHGDRALYLAQVKDQAQVADALKRFYQGDDRVQHQRRGQYDVWTVPEGSSLFVEGESDSVINIRSLALGENRMLFGTDVELLDQTLSGGPGSQKLKDDAGWLALWNSMRERAPRAALWGLTRLEDTMQSEYAQATAPPKEDEEASPISTLWRILLFGTAAEEIEVPYDHVPTFDQVRPALSRTSTLMTPAGDDWNVTISAERRGE